MCVREQGESKNKPSKYCIFVRFRRARHSQVHLAYTYGQYAPYGIYFGNVVRAVEEGKSILVEKRAAVPCAVLDSKMEFTRHATRKYGMRSWTKDTRPRTVSLQSHSTLNAKRNRESTVHANVSESCACAWLLVPRGWVLRCVVVVVGWLARWEGGCAPSGVRPLRAPG